MTGGRFDIRVLDGGIVNGDPSVGLEFPGQLVTLEAVRLHEPVLVPTCDWSGNPIQPLLEKDVAWRLSRGGAYWIAMVGQTVHVLFSNSDRTLPHAGARIEHVKDVIRTIPCYRLVS